ncbi:MAG: hypothetical protein K2O67_03255, partial [Clostridia bacterium]|nr:hypothetical protein [Clostridia bacterium]
MKRKKILFVCTGNTCRSPMAEAILRTEIKKRKIKWWDVASAGLHASTGSPMSENSRLALEEIGINYSDFKSRQLTQKLISSSTLVVTMTEEQMQLLDDCGNVRSVRDMCGFDIPDPFCYGIEVYRITRDALIKVFKESTENYILKFEDSSGVNKLMKI